MNGLTATLDARAASEPEPDRDPQWGSVCGQRFKCDRCGKIYHARGHISWGGADMVPVICRPCDRVIGHIRDDIGIRCVVG